MRHHPRQFQDHSSAINVWIGEPLPLFLTDFKVDEVVVSTLPGAETGIGVHQRHGELVVRFQGVGDLGVLLVPSVPAVVRVETAPGPFWGEYRSAVLAGSGINLFRLTMHFTHFHGPFSIQPLADCASTTDAAYWPRSQRRSPLGRFRRQKHGHIQSLI